MKTMGKQKQDTEKWMPTTLRILHMQKILWEAGYKKSKILPTILHKNAYIHFVSFVSRNKWKMDIHSVRVHMLHD